MHSSTSQVIPVPELPIEIRHKDDFQAGNFSRFPEIWLILIGPQNRRTQHLIWLDFIFKYS